MRTYSLKHLADSTLLNRLSAIVARDRAITAALLAHLAEVDERQLYAAAGYPSMLAYCVGELRLSDDAARKRIHAARTARRVPAVFAAVADGRLHLGAVVLLAPYLGPDNATELLAAATHRSKAEIERWLAERYPRLAVPTQIVPLDEAPVDGERAPGRVQTSETETPDAPGPERLPTERAPGRVATGGAWEPKASVVPLGGQRYALSVTIGQRTHDSLRYAQELLSHQVAPEDVAEILDRALAALVVRLEKRKFGATDRPSRPRPASANPRHVPAHVKDDVWQRDGGRCTFVSDAGHRCESRTMLEFDHVDPVARGGRSTVDNVRLRCRAHNQYEAERAFGREFMQQKRGRAAARQAEKRDRASRDHDLDVGQALRTLGFRADEVRRATGHCASMVGASLEDRVRVALSVLTPAHRRPVAPDDQRPAAAAPVFSRSAGFGASSGGMMPLSSHS